MLEVEMKFPVADFAEVEHRLAGWRARADGPREDVDHYLNAPDRDFARTDEALRLRRIGETNVLTYKGPKRDAHTKTRTEVEVPLRGGAEAAALTVELLHHLGYRSVREVRKRRAVFHLEREGFALEVCLDDVAGLGRFVELEIQAPEEGLDGAKAVLRRVADELGLSQSERRSYLELLLSRAQGVGP